MLSNRSSITRPRGLESRTLRPRRAAGVLGLALPLLFSGTILLTACGGSSDPPTAESETATARQYTVRGVVRGVPKADRPGSQLMIRHQAIPDFIDIKGEEVGMDAMTMPFPIAPDLSLETVAPGDAVEFELTVDWEADQPVAVTRIAKLPEGTEVDFSEPTEETADEAEDGHGAGHSH